MLYQLEHWDELDEEEKEAMETLKFIEKAHELLHEHDHLGLGDEHDHDHEADDSKVFADEGVNEEVAVQYDAVEEKPAEVPEAQAQKSSEESENNFEPAHAMDLNEEGPSLGFDLADLAGSGSLVDELRRLYSFITHINTEYRRGSKIVFDVLIF